MRFLYASISMAFGVVALLTAYRSDGAFWIPLVYAFSAGMAFVLAVLARG